MFDKVGVVRIGCNIHDWMSGIILVLPTPHFAVTDAAGHFVLENLPKGSYTLVAWHALSKCTLCRTGTSAWPLPQEHHYQHSGSRKAAVGSNHQIP